MVCWGRARTHHWRLFPGFPWLPLQWPSGSILGAVRVGSYLDTLVLRNPLIAASNTHITSFLSLVSQVESGIKLTCFLWALQISGVSKRAFIGTNTLTSFSHLSALYFLHQAVVLWLCHSKSLVDRTDRTRGNINLCNQSYTNTAVKLSVVLCVKPRFLPPWCTLEAGYLWRLQLMMGYQSYERWCTTAPYTEASASSRNKVRAQFGKKTYVKYSKWMMIPPAPCVFVLSLQGFHLP